MIGPKTTLTLQQWTQIPDGMGGFTHIHVNKRKMKGVLVSLTGNERYVTGKEEVFRTHRFMVDFPKGLTITEKDRFTLGIRTFDIQVVANTLEQNIQLQLDLLEIT